MEWHSFLDCWPEINYNNKKCSVGILVSNGKESCEAICRHFFKGFDKKGNPKLTGYMVYKYCKNCGEGIMVKDPKYWAYMPKGPK